jgi:hypothetical protein
MAPHRGEVHLCANRVVVGNRRAYVHMHPFVRLIVPRGSKFARSVELQRWECNVCIS